MRLPEFRCAVLALGALLKRSSSSLRASVWVSIGLFCAFLVGDVAALDSFELIEHSIYMVFMCFAVQLIPRGS